MEINGQLDEFYKIIEKNRDEHYGAKHGPEPVHWRNPMINALADSLKGGVCIDYLSGDLVVPLAVLFLQNQDSSLGNLEKIYAVDNGADGGFELIERNAKHFGLEEKVVPVRSDIDEDLDVPEADYSTLIEGCGYLCSRGGTVLDPESFFENFFKTPENHILQVGMIPYYSEERMRERYSQVSKEELCFESRMAVWHIIGKD